MERPRAPNSEACIGPTWDARALAELPREIMYPPIFLEIAKAARVGGEEGAAEGDTRPLALLRV